MVPFTRLSRAVKNNAIRVREEFRFRGLAGKSANGPSVLFCPSEAPTGASLLRAYNMAEALKPLGWVSAVIPHVIKPGQRERLIKTFDPDILVFQQCRHIRNDIAYSYGYPVILDTDDADFQLLASSRAVATLLLGIRTDAPTPK